MRNFSAGASEIIDTSYFKPGPQCTRAHIVTVNTKLQREVLVFYEPSPTFCLRLDNFTVLHLQNLESRQRGNKDYSAAPRMDLNY